MKLSIKANVFTTAAYDPRKIIADLRDGTRAANGLSHLIFASWEEMGGWAKMGTATIEMELNERGAVESVVAALREQMERERAEFAVRQKAILDQINSMLAIEAPQR